MLENPILTFLPQIVGGLLTLLGIAGTLVFFIGTRAGHAACCACGYDTSGQIAAAHHTTAAATQLTCPECGTTVASQAEWLERRHPGNWLLILAALLLMAAPIVGTWPLGATIVLRLFTAGHITVDRVAFGPFTATLEGLNWDWGILNESERRSDFTANRLTITCPDGTVFESRALQSRLGVECEPWLHLAQVAAPLVCGRGDDVSGDGVPDLVVTEKLNIARDSAHGLSWQTSVTIYSFHVASGRYELTARRLGEGAFTKPDLTGQCGFIRRLPVFVYAWTPTPIAVEPSIMLRCDQVSGKYCFDATGTKRYNAPLLAELLTATPENLEPGEGNRALLLRRFLTMLCCGEGDLALAHIRTFGQFCFVSDPDFRERFRNALETTAVSTDWMAIQPPAFRLWLGPMEAK